MANTPAQSTEPAPEPETEPAEGGAETGAGGAEPETEHVVAKDAFEEWHKNWSPPDHYLTLAQALELCESQQELERALPHCQCVGYTMHVTKELPGELWSGNSGWTWDIGGNKVFHPQFQSLPFQCAIFEDDLRDALGARRGEPVQDAQPPAPLAEEGATDPSDATESEPQVEILEDMEGLPQGWTMATIEGLAWQAQHPEEGLYGPMRLSAAQAVGDAWAYAYTCVWA